VSKRTALWTLRVEDADPAAGKPIDIGKANHRAFRARFSPQRRKFPPV
jgi:hypothetical protein